MEMSHQMESTADFFFLSQYGRKYLFGSFSKNVNSYSIFLNCIFQ